MKSYKELLNSLSNDSLLRQLTDSEVKELRKTFLFAFNDLLECCKKNNLTVMLIGGSVIGAVRHKGFIPWDDDLDVAMPRKDFEVLKRIFDKELGDKYILSSPNYRNNANNRFPMMLIKDTLLVEAGHSSKEENSKIKLDIFIIENIPDNIFRRFIKGIVCSAIMFVASCEEMYERKSPSLKQYMSKSKAGKRMYDFRVFFGRFFSFFSFQKWMDILDRVIQYNKETRLMGIPSGRGHYFGEIRPKDTFLPPSVGEFEGIRVKLPGNPDDYLTNLYGPDYMTLPPTEKRERHFYVDIRFKEKCNG